MSKSSSAAMSATIQVLIAFVSTGVIVGLTYMFVCLIEQMGITQPAILFLMCLAIIGVLWCIVSGWIEAYRKEMRRD